MSKVKYTHPLRVRKVRHSAMLDTMARTLDELGGPFSTRELIALWLDDWEERWQEKRKQGKAMRRVPRNQPTTVTVGMLLSNDPRFFNTNATTTLSTGKRLKPSGGSQWVLKSNHLSVTLVVE